MCGVQYLLLRAISGGRYRRRMDGTWSQDRRLAFFT